jgi:hypothetical protein
MGLTARSADFYLFVKKHKCHENFQEISGEPEENE